ncbi:unnamed protein product [Rhizoctonia solani]|uniref:NACHT domain-containing protein n=1 Tax=Rhizoctonia solani TaxID=456999 RepID=A0A8H2XJM6_9AGAM|nr:unnamed protein product [Rhizoctonia solani]
MLLKLKDSAKRRLRIGTRTQQSALLDLSILNNPTESSSTTIPVSALPTSPGAHESAGIAQKAKWNSSAISLPGLTPSTGEPLITKATDDNARPTIDKRNTTMKFRARHEFYLWSGLKTLWGILESGAETFGPLRSAIGGLKWWIDLYEVCNFMFVFTHTVIEFYKSTTKSNEEYNELKWWIDLYEVCNFMFVFTHTVIEFYKSTTKSNEEYNELRIKLDSLFGDLSKFVDRSANPTMLSGLTKLSRQVEFSIPSRSPLNAPQQWNHDGIMSELELVLQKQGTGSVQRYSEVLDDPDEVLRCYRRINGYLERFIFNSNLSIWETVDQQATDTLIGRLSFATSAMYDSAEATDVKRGPCAPKTRRKELEKLSGWAHGNQDHKIYWLNGMAGTGKTTIVYSLCAKLDSSHKLGASFFCSRMIPECRNVKYILPSIAYQLASFSSPFRYALSQTLKSDRDAHNRLLKYQFESLIAKPLLEAQHTLDFDIVVVIDALDECENENSIGQILDVLLGNDLNLPIRFLISSRPEPEIYRRMMKRVGENFDARLVLHELDQSAVKNDIKAYLTHELNDIPLTFAQIEALVERSGILFIYAATASAYIKAGYLLMEHEERLDMILGLSPPSEGKDRYIDELYTTILSAAFNNSSLDLSSRKRMGTILHAVVCAQEPMTTRALSRLLLLKSAEQVGALLRPLGSVLHVSEKNGFVSVLHTSFPDYLLDQQRSAVFHCNSTRINGLLAQACLGTIKHHDPQFNVCHLETSYYLDEYISDISGRTDRAISPELFYSCRHWANHLQLAEESDELAGLARDFLSCRLLLWMEVLNLKKSIHVGVAIMRSVEDWIRRTGNLEELVELAHDAWCFVMMFASHPVSRSTPHIYLSMLPFWPSDAPISLYYTPKMQNMIKPWGTALSRRQSALLATWSFGSQVMSTKFSPDGSRIAVAAGKELFIIDGYTGQRLVGPLKGHTNTVSSVEFSPDGLHIASSSWDGTIRVWNVQTGHMPIDPLLGHALSVEAIHFSPDSTRLVSGSWDRTLRVWHVATGGMILGPLQGHTAIVTAVAFSPDGRLIASGSSDKTIRIWEAQTGSMVHGPFQGHNAGVTSIAFSPDGSYLASGSRDSTIRLWGVQRGYKNWTISEGRADVITAIQFSPDSQRIVSASEDKVIRIHVLENATWKESISLRGHTDSVTAISFSQDGSRILSGSSDNSVRIWDAKTRRPSWSPPSQGHYNEVHLVQYLFNDTCIISRSIDGVIQSWHSQTGQKYDPYGVHWNSIKDQNCAAFSGDGSIVSGSRGGIIQTYPIDHPDSGVTLVSRRGAINALAWSPNNKYIASGSGGAVQLWDISTGQIALDHHNTPPDNITSVVFSPNSNFIAATSGDIIIVWDIESDQKSHMTLKGHTKLTVSISFSPDNELIASGSKDTTVRVWSPQSGNAVLGPFQGHTAEVSCLAFSPDGTRVASASRDMRICLWDLRSENMLFETLEGHTGAVLSVAFSHSGSHIVSGSSDCTIRVWDVRDDISTSIPDGINRATDAYINFQPWTLTHEGWVADPKGRFLLWRLSNAGT